MRLLVDARLLQAGGIGRYLREVSSRWLVDERVERIHFLGRPEELAPWLVEADERGIASVTEWRDGPYSHKAQFRWPSIRRALPWKPDATFFPHYDVPLIGHPTPSVLTVHDLIHFRVPEAFPWWKRAAGTALLRRALNLATQVVTVSENSRRDLEAFHSASRAKIRVVPNGVSEVFRPLEHSERKAAETRWGYLRPYVLSVGPAKAHKNLGLAVEVVRRVRQRWPELRLCVVGAVGSHSLLLGKGRTSVPSWISILDPPSDRELREIYALAETFLFPSLYEGFGLPPLEAMACGTAVVASNTSSIPEVLGDSATLLDPREPDQWEEALVQSLMGLGEHQPLTEAGEVRARGASWRRCAIGCLQALEEAAHTDS